MSLYNKLFDENPDATALLGMIHITRNDFSRYRNVFLNTEGTIIKVFTRLGGPNRKDYKDVIKQIKKNPFYIKNYDDNFDNTYAYFEFKVPENYLKTCKMIAPSQEFDFGKEFLQFMEESKIPGTEAYKKTDAIANEILKGINSGNHFIGL